MPLNLHPVVFQKALQSAWLKYAIAAGGSRYLKAQRGVEGASAEIAEACKTHGKSAEDYVVEVTGLYSKKWLLEKMKLPYLPYHIVVSKSSLSKIIWRWEGSVPFVAPVATVERHVQFLQNMRLDVAVEMVRSGFCGHDKKMQDEIIEKLVSL